MQSSAASRFITQTYQKPYRPAKIRDASEDQKPPLTAPSDPYHDFIWALARKFTNSREEAEAAVREMQADISRCAEPGIYNPSDEDRLVARIAWRRLLKFLQ